jgi:hypothetical protein
VQIWLAEAGMFGVSGRGTFFVDVDAGMVEEEVSKRVALGVDVGLPAEARGPEERKGLQCAQRRLALGHRHRRARHCMSKHFLIKTRALNIKAFISLRPKSKRVYIQLCEAKTSNVRALD